VRVHKNCSQNPKRGLSIRMQLELQPATFITKNVVRMIPQIPLLLKLQCQTRSNFKINTWVGRVNLTFTLADHATLISFTRLVLVEVSHQVFVVSLRDLDLPVCWAVDRASRREWDLNICAYCNLFQVSGPVEEGGKASPFNLIFNFGVGHGIQLFCWRSWCKTFTNLVETVATEPRFALDTLMLQKQAKCLALDYTLSSDKAHECFSWILSDLIWREAHNSISW